MLVPVACALMPVAYVFSVASLVFLLNARILPKSVGTWPVTQACISPVWWYMDADYPGAKACDALLTCSKQAGQRLSSR